MGLEGHVGCKRRQTTSVSLAVAQDAPRNVQATRARGLQGHWRCVWSKLLIFADTQVLVVLCSTYILGAIIATGHGGLRLPGKGSLFRSGPLLGEVHDPIPMETGDATEAWACRFCLYCRWNQ